MKPRNALVSKVAAAALAFGLVQGAVAWADETTAQPSANTSTQTASTQPVKGDLVSNWTISADPLIPIGLIAGLGLLYGAASLMAARGKTKGAWLRAAAGGVMVVTLVNPEILTEERESIPTEVVVVVDKSDSQKLDGRDVTTQAAYDDVIRQLARIPGTNVRTIEYTHEIDGRKDGRYDGTQLFKRMENGFADIPRERLGAVIILTDGVVGDAKNHDINRLLGNDAPLHALVSGKDTEVDRRIILEGTPIFADVNSKQKFRFSVVDDGADNSDPNKQISVKIKNGGQEIDAVMVRPGQMMEVSVDIPHAGENFIEFIAEPLAGELTTFNNRAVKEIQGTQKAQNILLVSGAPDANMRMWRNALKSKVNVNLVNISILRPPEKQDNTPLKELSMISLPAQEIFADKLKEFDLVIFDHYAYDGLVAAPYLANVAKYVREGGSLMVVAGPEYATNSSLSLTPLNDVLPAQPNGQVIEKSFVPTMNKLGERHPVAHMLNREAKFRADQSRAFGPWLRMVGVNGTKGTTVMDGADGRPLLVLNRQNEGRVAMLLSDHAWLWGRAYQGGGPVGDLITDVTSWLLKDQKYEEESLQIYPENGYVMIQQRTMADSSTPVTLKTPSGKTIQLTPSNVSPGQWEARIPADEVGGYSVTQAGPHPAMAYTDVGSNYYTELTNVISTTEILSPLAKSRGGEVLRMQGAAGNSTLPNIRAVTKDNAAQGLSGKDWIGVKMNGETVLKGVTGEPLLPPWLSLILIIGALAQAYAREGDRSIFKAETWKRTPKNNNNGPQI